MSDNNSSLFNEDSVQENNSSSNTVNNQYNQDAYSGNYGGLKKVNKYSFGQMSMMSIAMLVAGLGFLLTGLIGFGFMELIKQSMMGNDTSSNIFYGFVSITSIAGIVSLIMYFIWIFRIERASLGFQISIIVIYCLSNGITFGGIFYFVNVPEIILAFGFVGLTLLITFIISKIISHKVAMAMGKMIMIISLIYLVFLLVSIILSAFNILPSVYAYENNSVGQWIYAIVIGVSGFLSILFLTYNLYVIQNMDKFRDQMDPIVARNYAIYFGFIILINLIRIFYIVIQIIGRIRN